ncbi:uncharacterized protein G2W53_040782 [Senna tora]|uniref:Uncharacterized protein n=1 Tax=Senna tora TaxID=362788 RepID=A0A834SEN4_9FABA|nr:uncharacterized protein G2W53_040782 [Senna tora]
MRDDREPVAKHGWCEDPRLSATGEGLLLSAVGVCPWAMALDSTRRPMLNASIWRELVLVHEGRLALKRSHPFVWHKFLKYNSHLGRRMVIMTIKRMICLGVTRIDVLRNT